MGNGMEDVKEKIITLVKEHIKVNGVSLPFKAANLKYSNDSIDPWFRIKEDGKVIEIKRKTQEVVI